MVSLANIPEHMHVTDAVHLAQSQSQSPSLAELASNLSLTSPT
jgi:hypothetical protein